MAFVVTLAYYPFLFTWIGNITSSPINAHCKAVIIPEDSRVCYTCEINGDAYILPFFPRSSAL